MIRLLRLEEVPADAWDALLGRLVSPPPFLSRRFLLPWRDVFAQGRDARAAAWSPPGGPVEGLLFLLRRPGGGWTFLGSEEVADYLDAVVAPGREEAFWREFLSEGLPALGGGPLDLPGLVEGAATLVVLPRLCAEAGRPCRVEEMDRAPFVGLPGTFDGYLSSLGGKERHELRRKMRRAGERLPGLAFRVTRTAEELERDLPSFLDLHRKSHPGKERFMDDRMADFFRGIATGFLREGTLRLAFLSGGGEDVASAFQFRTGRAVLLYNSGYDPGRREAHPGLVLIARCIEHALGEGAREYDFLRGTERYKYDLGGVDRVVYRVTVPM
jgi:CelD/BcsL family acetyltransferase involved in cellulose biosynthesis